MSALLALLLALAADPLPAETDYCTSETPNCRGWQAQHDALAWIKLENAEKEAEAAIAAGDYRLWGVRGFTVVTPGAGARGVLPNGCGLRVIDGTSDMLVDVEAQIRAGDYAELYNKTVVARTGCLNLPVTRNGMAWSDYTQDAVHSLSFGPGEGYDLLAWICYGGQLHLRFDRAIKDDNLGWIAVKSGGVRQRPKMQVESLDQKFFPGFEAIEIRLQPEDEILTAFAATGRLTVGGDRFDAQTDQERAAVRRFVEACRATAL